MSDAPTRLTPRQRAWVEQCLPRVRSMARALAPRIPHATSEELESAGNEGLVEAALRYDPASGVPFRAFAHYRVRGAMIDAARKVAPAIRRRSRALQALEASQSLLERAQRREPRGDAIDQRSLRERVDAAAALVAQTTTAVLLSKLAPTDPDTLSAAEGDDVERRLLDRELMAQLRVALDTCTPEESALVTALYFEGRSMNEYAEACGVSASTVSRHHARLLAKLGNIVRARMRG